MARDYVCGFRGCSLFTAFRYAGRGLDGVVRETAACSATHAKGALGLGVEGVRMISFDKHEDRKEEGEDDEG